MIQRVVKLGGSLAFSNALPKWLTAISQCRKHRIIVVPGGGVFADQVRAAQQKLNFDDRTAHQMALLAMQQYGLMIRGLHSAFEPVFSLDWLSKVMAGDRVPIWMPDPQMLERAGINASWDITSDSLSLWVANKLSVDHLILVKSVPRINDTPKNAKQNLNRLVDNAFFNAPRKPKFPISIVGREDYTQFSEVIIKQSGNLDYNQRSLV